MPNISKEKPEKTSIHSLPPCIVDYPSWWNSSMSQMPQSFIPTGQGLNMNSPPRHFFNVKPIDCQLQEHDSSSTQSTGESHSEFATMEGAGCMCTYEKEVEGQMKSVLSLGTPNFVFPTSQVFYSQALVHVPYPCPDPYYGGLLTPSGTQSLIHPQVVTMAPARVPLPLDLAENEPIYVNAKQYHGILRRRQYRAKLEAQNKLAKDRKPYLHESRHLHALKRVRGSGGRFLSKTELQNCNHSPSTDGENASHSALPLLCMNHLESEVLQLEASNAAASTTSCSDVSSVSNADDMQLQPDPRFSSYPHMGGSSFR